MAFWNQFKDLNVKLFSRIDAPVWQSTVRIICVCFLIAGLGACASNPNTQFNDGTQPEEVKNDRFESFNRVTFKFNDTLDAWFLKPVAKGYSSVIPKPLRRGVGNFFSNLGEVSNIINDGLQWKWKQAANDTGRLLINSTLGLFGLFDVAAKTGLEKSDGEDFTQTLAAWGVPRGPYLVLPFLGPTTVRGGVSFPVDWVTSPMQYVDSTNTQIVLNGVEIVHDRSELLQTEELISGDRYSFIREVFLQRLEYLEKDGEVVDDFGGEFDDDEYGDDEYGY